jgi:quaternary ammonium compound-resistance protein SugE
MNWIYLFIAALLETAWTFSLKEMSFSDLRKLSLTNFYTPEYGLPILLPFIGYIIFGIGNIYLFSMAMKHIPAAIAFAVWTSATLIFIKIADALFFHQKIEISDIFYTLLIVIGIVGLKTKN